MHDFINFPSAKFHDIWTQHVHQWSDKNFLNRILKILPFPEKLKHFSNFLNFLRRTNRRKFTTNSIKWSLYGMSSYHFYRWNQFTVIRLAYMLHTRNVLPNFSTRRMRVTHGNYRYIRSHQMAPWTAYRALRYDTCAQKLIQLTAQKQKNKKN